MATKQPPAPPKITPFLWFDDQAETAARFYTSLFEDAEILDIVRYGPAGPGPEGQVMTVRFQLAGQELIALNGGPFFTLDEAFSLSVACEDQAEIDRLWNALIADGGAPSQCGWLKDRFGLSWQIVPRELPALLGDPDPERSRRATEAMLQMTKLDIARLRAARDAS